MTQEQIDDLAQIHPRRIARLERYLKQGKVLMQSVDAVARNGRLISTLASLKKVSEDKFVAGITVYPATVDTGRLRDNYYDFQTLTEAMTFITHETGILFHQMEI